jgi:hypothetical protein
LFFHQMDLDQKQQTVLITVIAEEVFNLSAEVIGTSSAKKFSNIICWVVITPITMGLHLLGNKLPKSEKIAKGIDFAAKHINIIRATQAVAFFALGFRRSAAARITSLGLSILRKNGQLPSGIYNFIDFCGIPIDIFFLVAVPGSGLIVQSFLVLKIFMGTVTFLKDNGIFDFDKLIRSKKIDVRDIDYENIKDVFSKAKSIDDIEIEFDRSSINRIPCVMNEKLDDGLADADKKTVVSIFKQKIESLGINLEKDYSGANRIIKEGYLEEIFRDFSPHHRDKFNQYINIFLRKIILKIDSNVTEKEKKDHVQSQLKYYDEFGIHCTDGWIDGVCKAYYADKSQSTLHQKIHEKLAEVRDEKLSNSFFINSNESRINMLDYSGGVNNVHTHQELHLLYYDDFKTKTGHAAQMSTQNNLDLWLTKRIRRWVYGSFCKVNEKSFFSYFEETKNLDELLQDMLKQEKQSNDSYYSEIGNGDLTQWVYEKNETYSLFDEVSGMFSNKYFVDNDIAKLTDLGRALILADAGVVRVRLRQN